ncbi:MAG: hypothetical protein AAF245_13740, partial [Pseudomonadota bacterium]
GTLPELLARHGPEVEGIVVWWRNFGDSGLAGLPSRPVTDVYTQAVSAQSVIAQPNYGQSKQIYRHHARFPFLSAHGGGLNPATPNMPARRGHLVTPKGRVIDPAVWGNIPVPFDPPFPEPEWEVAQINHYLTKTRAQMHLRHTRGSAHSKGKYDQRYFWTQNRNEEEDLTIRRTADARNAALAKLMADPVLSELHAAAVTQARAEIQRFHASRAPS